MTRLKCSRAKSCRGREMIEIKVTRCTPAKLQIFVQQRLWTAHRWGSMCV